MIDTLYKIILILHYAMSVSDFWPKTTRVQGLLPVFPAKSQIINAHICSCEHPVSHTGKPNGIHCVWTVQDTGQYGCLS